MKIVNLKLSLLLILSYCFVSGQTNKALQFKSILEFVAKSSKTRSMVALAVPDSNNIQFNIIDTVNSVGDKSNIFMVLYSDYLSHKYKKTVKEWDSDSSILSSADSLAQLIKPYYSKDLRKLSSPTSPVNCKFIEYEPTYIGVLITGPLKESSSHYRMIDPEFSTFILFHFDSSDDIKLVGEHIWYSGITR